MKGEVATEEIAIYLEADLVGEIKESEGEVWGYGATYLRVWFDRDELSLIGLSYLYI